MGFFVSNVFCFTLQAFSFSRFMDLPGGITPLHLQNEKIKKNIISGTYLLETRRCLVSFETIHAKTTENFELWVSNLLVIGGSLKNLLLKSYEEE